MLVALGQDYLMSNVRSRVMLAASGYVQSNLVVEVWRDVCHQLQHDLLRIRNALQSVVRDYATPCEVVQMERFPFVETLLQIA
jgi:hypothetical protein